ncbi:MAG: RseA family anti-sigma factor [Succinivibrio sp.]|nr:RseA family anti-sigma factor [Succinivibrio sp.]
MLDSKQTNWEEQSALFDSENVNVDKVELNDELKDHLNNWSLIGATLRDELPKQVNVSFADNLMVKIEQEKIKPEPRKVSFNFTFKKVAFAVSQFAIAASVAAVTIIGWQTFNADEKLGVDSTSTSLGSVNGVNLASYQTSQTQKGIKLNQHYSDIDSKNGIKMDEKEFRKQQALEVDRINNYIRGYVFTTASND